MGRVVLPKTGLTLPARSQTLDGPSSACVILLSCPLFVCSILLFLLPYNKSFIVELEWHDGLDYEGKEMCWGEGGSCHKSVYSNCPDKWGALHQEGGRFAQFCI